MDWLNSTEEDQIDESEEEDGLDKDEYQFDNDFEDDQDIINSKSSIYNGPDVEGLPRGEEWLLS